jgi:hypothetical protein
MFGAFASFGGLAYAAEGVDHRLTAVARLLASPEDVARVNLSSPAADQYGSPPPANTPPAGGALGAGGGFPSAQVSPIGDLPFTGFPIFFTAAIGLGILGLGVVLHRREKRR